MLMTMLALIAFVAIGCLVWGYLVLRKTLPLLDSKGGEAYGRMFRDSAHR